MPLDHIISILIAGVTLGAFYALLFYIYKRLKAKDGITKRLKQIETIYQNAEKEAEEKLRKAELQAKEKLFQARQRMDKEIQEKREAILEQEKRIIQREKNIERKANLIDEKEDEVKEKKRELNRREDIIATRENDLEFLINEQKTRLEHIAGMTMYQAKEELKKNMESAARSEMVNYIQRIEAEAKERADVKARNIICSAVNKIAGDAVIFNSVSIVELPNEEMKGRIIGREGRNIRAIEMATGVDILVDNTPNAVVLSGFNALRREIARIAIEKLVEDGRIHPARIEEMVEKARIEVDKLMVEEGEALIFELDIHNLHPKLAKLLGKLKYKTENGINLYQHSRDVALHASGMAEELDLDVQLIKRAALFHDIGNACDSDEFEGTILERSIDALTRYEESKEVIDMVESLHLDSPASAETAILCAAHAVAMERPGVSDEVFETHLQRLEKLESLASGFKGVTGAYAIRSGKEVRIIVDSENVSDNEVVWLSKDIASRVESETEYSGQIKVVVIRQTRAFDIAT